MAALEKLVKSLEALKSLISSTTSVDESRKRSKEKMTLCIVITDMICAPDTKKTKNFQPLLSYSMETLFKMCDDTDSGVRMIADECLNRIIRTHMDTNIVKLTNELHNEIKKNQSARSLRAALWRFAELAHLMKPIKAKSCMQNLVRCFTNIAGRNEEAVLETTATSMPKILSALGCFMTDSEVKHLLETFMKNLHSENTVLRRTASSIILSICLHCPKPQFFLIHTLTSLLDTVLPLKDDETLFSILGVLNCIRGIIPHLDSDGKETFLYGSFGTKRKRKRQAVLSVDSLIQIYELCLHWSHHCDHNVVAASLETLNELLTHPPSQLVKILVGNQGLEKSRIHTSSSTWNLSNRTLSEISVVAPLDASILLEDSLLENEETPKMQWLLDVNEENSLVLPPISPGNISPNALDFSDYQDSESVASEDLGLVLKRPKSPEPDMIPLRESPSPILEVENTMVWYIGEAVETNECPLLYCARRLVTNFLILECTNARVSVRALALNCLTQVVRLNPLLFLQEVDKNGLSTPQGFSRICDVYNLVNHGDPQLRGLIRVLIGTFINSMYTKHSKSSANWFTDNLKADKKLSLEKLITILIEGLKDESSICVRHTLTGFGICLINLMENDDFLFAIPMLEKLLETVENPYWLVKVKLIELLSMLPFQCVHFITSNDFYQKRVLDCIILLLSNDDERVRKATSEGIVNLVKNLYFPIDYADDVILARGIKSYSFSFKNGPSKIEKEHNEKVLSRLIVILIENFMISSSKYLLTGCIEALSLLSEKYTPIEYCKSWQFVTDINSSCNVTSSGLFLHTVTLLSSSSLSLDLECHQQLLKLAGNLITGVAANPLCVNDKKLVAGAHSLLTHVMRLLAIFVQVIEESSPSRSVGASPLRRRTSRASSPPKILSDKEKKEEKKPAIGQYGTNPHYSKLKDVVRAGYNNYKLTLEYSGSEKFLSLLFYSLKTMEDLVEQYSIIEVPSLYEEILQYLRTTFVLDAASTVKVANRLLKSLFSRKEPSDISEIESGTRKQGFYDNIFQKCLNEFSENLFANYEQSEEPEKNENEKNQEKPQIDHEELSRKIKLFEPIVFLSFTEYTSSNNIKLQVEVLILLTQLIRFKVCYSLLDNGLVFLKSVKEQLEYLESGQIRHAELLIPQIFTYLVSLLKKSRQENLNIEVPQIIQMCDGLMASGQNPVTHSIPALGPVVQYIFMSTTNVNDENELETQREVVLAMLFRLAEYPQVLDIIYGLMKEGWRWEEHWNRWYRQVIETIRPLLAEGRLVVNECNTLHALFSLKSNSAPLNHVLILLFTHQQEGQSLEHWLGMITTMLFCICSYKEEKVLLQIEEMNLYVREEGDDPLKVKFISKTISPQHLLSKLLMRVIHTSVVKVNEIFSEEINICVEKMFSNFLLCCVYLFDSGNYNEVANSLKVLLKSTEVQEIHKSFVALASSSPNLTLLWAEILTLLGIGDVSLWSELIQNKKNSLNYSVVKQGSVLLFCKYLAKNPQDLTSLGWLLENEVRLVVHNCQEPPVEEMLNSIYNIEENSQLLLNSLSICVRNVQPVFAHRVLQTLKNVHSKYTGSVLLVGMELVEHKNIAIARLSAAFCSRIIEYMLTLENDSVQNLLKKEEIILLLKKLTSGTRQYKRHNALISLLKKLGEQIYSTKSSDFEPNNEIDLEKILSTKLDKSWLLDQIIKKCNKNVDSDKRKCARLLSQLDVEDLQYVMRNDFNLNILPHCFTIGTQLSLKLAIKDKNCKTPETLVPLYDCARTVLLFSIAKISKALPLLDTDLKSKKEQLNVIFNKIDIKGDIMPVVKGLINYLNSFKDLLSPSDTILKIMPEQQPENVLKFGLFCLQIIHWVVETSKKFDEWPWMCENLLECASAVLSIDYLCSLLTLESISCISACLFDLHRSICKKDIPLKDLIDCDNETKEKDVILNIYLEVASLVSSLNSLNCCPVNVRKRFKSIVVSLGRNQKVNWYSRIPVEAWPLPSEKTNLPQIPEHLLHDTEILAQIVSRVRLLGWTDRHQFEEIWVSLLSALNTNPDFENTDPDEISSIMQANSLVIDGITSLVLSTIETPNSHFQLLHIPRLTSDQLYKLPVWNRLEEMNEILCWKIRTINNEDKPKLVRVDKRPNLERIQNPNSYNFGQVSVAYLQTRISDDDGENLILNFTKNGKNVDIRSCVQFMLDLFGQWALPNSGISLNLQLSMVKSILCLSDMFTERTHFEWMFNTFVSFLKIHPQQDEILHQYVIIGISKSAAVLNICEGETSEKILKMIDCSLKSNFVPMKIAGLNGLLYLLQNVQNIKKSEPNVEVVKLSQQEFRNKILDMTIDFMYKYSSEENNDDALLILSLGMYLMEVFPDESIDNISTPTMLKVLTPLIQNPKNDFMYQAGIHGLERLVLLGNAGFNEQITRFALDRFSDSDPKISLPALQLLIACIYAEKIKIDRENSQLESTDNPLFSMEIMEKTTALFDKINRGYPVEVEIVCEILPGILSDFFPASDVLNKVISEFLSPNQPHKKNMAAMVFQVFTQACEENQLPLLQLWVVHSLKNFLNNLPAVTAVWSLCCFFISASQNPWLKAMFPHVQSRIRQYDFEDRQILCIAAVDFYNQLDSKQQEMFRQSFKDANTTQKSVFSDIISCLR